MMPLRERKQEDWLAVAGRVGHSNESSWPDTSQEESRIYVKRKSVEGIYGWNCVFKLSSRGLISGETSEL